MTQRKYLVKAVAEFEIEVTADGEEEAKKIADDTHWNEWDIQDFEIYNVYDRGGNDETAI